MEKITCQICGAQCHSIQLHLRAEHKDVLLSVYQKDYPDAPIMSSLAESTLAKKREKNIKMEMAGATATVTDIGGIERVPMHEAFGLGKVKAALNGRGKGIPIQVMSTTGEFADMIPEQDEKYVFSIDLLKTELLGLELGIPVYLWGHAGTASLRCTNRCVPTRIAATSAFSTPQTPKNLTFLVRCSPMRQALTGSQARSNSQ